MAVDADMNLYSAFCRRLASTAGQQVLELGTRRVAGDPSTVRRHLAHPESTYIASDFQQGLDVDVVADAHALSETFGCDHFDMILACSTFEHIQRPWIAAKEMAAVTKPGGWVFVQTHQTFPLHAHPHDYFRFSREALEMLFQDAGMTILGSAYEFPAKIVTERIPGAEKFPAFLNVVVLCEKPA